MLRSDIRIRHKREQCRQGITNGINDHRGTAAWRDSPCPLGIENQKFKEFSPLGAIIGFPRLELALPGVSLLRIDSTVRDIPIYVDEAT
jgi:hypothetical protein